MKENNDNFCPFQEARENIKEYNYFFSYDSLYKENLPQSVEDWLNLHYPNEYCYAWLYPDEWPRKDIIGLVGLKNKEDAVNFRMTFGAELLSPGPYDEMTDFDSIETLKEKNSVR